MKRILLLIAILCSLTDTMATHLAGGVFEVECIGGNQFRIILRKYRDVTGVGLAPNYPIFVRNVATGNVQNLVVTQTAYNQALAPPVTNPCLVPPPNSAIDEGVYAVTTTLANGSAYQIYEQDGNRNTTSNLVGQPGQSIYAEFPDPAVYGCNNSPKFINGPPVSVCINEPLNYNNSAIDIDGDSVAYRFCEALNNTPATPPFNSVPYQNPYNSGNPVAATPALSIDPVTGFVSGTPNVNGKWVFTVCMDEFRNGVKIGEYRRDVQMTVTTCNTQNQANVNTSYTSLALGIPVIASCDDFSVTFQNSSTGATSYWWDFGVPGITNDTSNAQNPTYVYPDTGTFTATLIINKGFICADTVYRTVIVYPVINAGFATSLPRCINQPVQFTDTSDLTYGTVDFWIWNFPFATPSTSGQPSPAPRWTTAGTYNVRLVIESSKGCRDTIFQPVTVSPNPAINLATTYTVCEGQAFTIPAQTNGVTYQWTPSTGLSCDTCLNPVATPAVTTPYQLTVTNASGCTTTKTTTIIVRPSPQINAGPDQFLCGTGSVQLQAVQTGTPQALTWNWAPPTGLSVTNQPTTQASPPATTTYIVTATNPATGCVDRDTITVFLNAVSVDGGAGDTICPGDTVTLNGTTPVSAATFQWTPATNISDPTVANPDVWPAVTTWYTLTITDPVSGCNGVDSVLVVVNPLPPVNAGNDTTICINTVAQLSATGASTYVWDTDPSLSNTAIRNPIASPGATKTYYVTGADAIGCTNRDSVRVTVVGPAAVTITPDTTICANTVAQLRVTGGGTYAWSPAGTLNNTTIFNPVASPTNTTQYSVTITDGNGCIIDTGVTVTVTPPPAIDAGNPVQICAGDTVTLTATGGLSYVWTPNNNIIGATTASPRVHPAASTTYFVTGTDANGCSNVDSVRVTVNTLANGGFSPTQDICIGESVGLTASGFTQYTWSPAASLSCTGCANPVASPTSTTTYTVVVADNNGCVDSGTVLVNVNPLPVITASSTQTICVDDSVRITASSPNAQSYSWTPAGSLNNSTVNNPFASPTNTTVYTVRVTDNKGCIDSATIQVTVNQLPTIVLPFNTTTICDGDSVQLPVSGGVTYSWLPNTFITCTACPDPIVFPDLNRWYTVSVTDAIGCTNKDSILVRVNKLQPGNFVRDTAICIGESVQLFANGFTSYSWFPGTNLTCTNCPTPTATPTVTTTYFAAVEDANGCKDTGSVLITINPLPTVTASADVTICANENTQLTVTAPTATSVSWSPSAGLNNATVFNPTASPVATTNYTVTATDANGCTNQDNVLVTVNPRPNVNGGNDVTICFGDTIGLQANGAVSYTWLPATNISNPNVANPQVFPGTTTTYTVTGTGANGCTQTDAVLVTVNALPVVTVSPNSSICLGENVQLAATGGTSYLWTPATGLSNANIANPVASPTNTTVYTVRVGNAAGCFAEASTEVFVATPASIGIPNDTSVCPGTSVTLNIIGGVTFDWEPKVDITGANTATPTITPTQPRTYTVNILDNNGCDINGVVTIGIYTPADPLAGTDATICIGESAVLTATNGVTYTWEPAGLIDDNTLDTAIATPGATTVFTVTITDNNGCENTDQVTITVQPLPNVDAGPDLYIYEGARAVLKATGASSYVWSPGLWMNDTTSAEPIIFPDDTITYYVVGTDLFGCSNVDTINVFVLPSPKFYVPTAISPNGDGQNDQFLISYFENFNLISLRIFNRWGVMVFETDDIGRPWDGRSSDGQPLPIGTYVYIIEGVDDIGMPQHRQGNITIIR